MISTDYENQLINAIQTIVDSAVAHADFDKTIKATIISCVDEATGKYKVKYQDSTFYAYSNNLDSNYFKGTSVYVLVPGNDTTQNKTIIGSVDALGANYVPTTEGENSYNIYGKNCVENESTVFELCSYKKTDSKILYDFSDNINLINLNTKDVDEYIKETSTIICGASFKTSLDAIQRYKGNYGINFELVFKDNNGQEVSKNYIVDINEMSGNPYNFNSATRQSAIYEINNTNFERIEQVSIFAYDFPNTLEDNFVNDIFISKVEIMGANKVSSDELNAYALSLITKKGIYFEENEAATAKRTIEAELKVKGRLINNDTKSIKYYWFKENNRINSASPFYNQYGGTGWECLNDYNIVEKDSSNNPILVEWIPATEIIYISKKDLTAKRMSYKCVAVYDENILNKTITLYNYDSNCKTITVTSTNGTQFYFDNGVTDLICQINEIEETSSDYTYSWSVIDKNNNFKILETTQDEIYEYNNAISGKESLENSISAGLITQAEAKEQLDLYNKVINKYESKPRVDGNRLYNVKANTIVDFNTYKCSAYYKNNYLGTGVIILTNSFDAEERELTDYGLIINNGNQVFQYNENGVAPTSRSLTNPQIILPLDFTLFDKTGNIIEVTKNIQWKVPKKNTLLVVSAAPDEEDDNYKIYKDITNLTFSISNIYYSKNNNNNIILEVQYDDHIILGTTSLTFIKQGEIGTNGTDIVCKLIPNTVDESAMPQYPICTYNGTTTTLNYTTPSSTDKWFKIQMWENGEKIFEGTQSGTRIDDSSTNVEIKWSMLKNKYTSLISDDSNFVIDPNSGSISFDSNIYDSPANIVKCEITMNDNTYYALIPITLVRLNTTGYSISIDDLSGFREVMYSSDGSSPAYDSTSPFEIHVHQADNDISVNENITYGWSIKGKTYVAPNWQSNLNLVTKKGFGLNTKKNQKYYVPNGKYNGLCVNNAIYTTVAYDGSAIGSIHIPVYLYLNRFGYAALNKWDGNSISLDNNGGSILTPQIGTGQKDSNNAFTGLFMGSVQKSDGSAIENGLFGYKSGERTIDLSADTGVAKFGKAGSGQVIIDPSTGAKIQGGNYIYTGNEQTGSGMEIDLAKPTIKYGTGNFELDEDGNMKCRNADIRGNVFLPDGGKVIGGDGLYSLIQFNNGEFKSVGVYWEAYSMENLTVRRQGITMVVNIPKNFQVAQAYCSLVAKGLALAAGGGDYFWCYPKYITLQYGTDNTYDIGHVNAWAWPSDNPEGTNVKDNNNIDVFGVNGWTSTPFTFSDTTWRKITSENFSDFFQDENGKTKPGMYIFYINSKVTYDINVDTIWGLYTDYQSDSSQGAKRVTNIYITNNGVQRPFTRDELSAVYNAIPSSGSYPKYASNNGDIYHVECNGQTWNLNRHDFSAWYQENAQALKSNYMFPIDGWGEQLHTPDGDIVEIPWRDQTEFFEGTVKCYKLSSNISAVIDIYGYTSLALDN